MGLSDRAKSKWAAPGILVPGKPGKEGPSAAAHPIPEDPNRKRPSLGGGPQSITQGRRPRGRGFAKPRPRDLRQRDSSGSAQRAPAQSRVLPPVSLSSLPDWGLARSDRHYSEPVVSPSS